MALWTETARPRAVREHPRAGWLAVATVCFGAFMGQLDAGIVTLTFPALGREFGAGLAAVQWVSLAYLLVLVSLLVAIGRFADRVGRKAVYLQGFVLFTAASAACGLAPALWVLVACRVAQAVGAAMLQANSVALVVTSVPRAAMRAALGVQAAAQALGLALGPTAGALLVSAAGWRWVFLVNVPVGIAAVIAGRYLLPRTRERSSTRGTAGLVPLAVAASALLLGLSATSGLGLPAPLLFAVSAAAVVAFVLRVRRAARPLIPPGLLARPAVAAGLAGSLCGYLVLFAPLALFPQVYAADGVTGGLVLTALPAGFALAAVLSGRARPRRGPGRTVGPGTMPGRPGTAQGRPVAPGTAPGRPGPEPGRPGTAPGRTAAPGTAPGRLGTAPGRLGTAPGRLGTAPGRTADAAGVPRRTAGTGSRGRAAGAAVTCAVAAGLLAPWAESPWRAVVLLAVLGLGLGVYIPANNAAVMGAIPAGMSGAGGGLVNMARGLGTALGVALVTLCLHVADARVALLLVAAVAAVAAGCVVPRSGRQ